MRREFTAISAFSTIIALTAGVVLCMQTTQARLGAEPRLPGMVLGTVELTVFGIALYLWRPRASFLGWLLGIAGLAVIRIALTSGAGTGLSLVRTSPDIDAAIAESSAFGPRMLAVLFALMVGYPLRVFLPAAQARKHPGFANSPAISRAMSPAQDGDRGLLIVTVKDRASAPAERLAAQGRDIPGNILSSAPLIEGEIRLPVSTVLAAMPEQLVTDRALALGDSETMAFPLQVIHPQLKEAQIVFSVDELRACFPQNVRKALVQPADSDFETENGLVSVPLELVVPLLPPEALELPPPSPPAWAKVDSHERVVFATV